MKDIEAIRALPKRATCTTQEAARLLGVTDARVRQLILAGQIPATGGTDGRAKRIQARDLQAFAERERGRGRPRKGGCDGV